MQEILNNRCTIIEDEEVLSKFNSFRDGIGDVLSYLYKKNNYYYLVMSPYDSLFLEEEFCIRVDGKERFLNFIDDLACNIGLIIMGNKGKLAHRFISNTVKCGSYVYDLIDIDDLFISSFFSKNNLMYGNDLVNFIEKNKTSIFSSDRDPFVSPYIYNTMYKKIISLPDLSLFEISILDKYKKRGYEFINTFLRDGCSVKRNFGSEMVNKVFIDELYCLYDMFDKFPVLDKDMVVFRGGCEEEAFHFEHNSFISTSLDLTVATGFSSCLLSEIILPKGTHYIPIDLIDGLSSIFGETEAEILLRPSSFELITSGIRKELNYLKVVCYEKDNFGEMIVRTLENKKNDLIKGRFCDEEGYDDVLSYAKSKCSSIKVKRLK